MPSPALPAEVRRVTERRADSGVHEHPEWAASMPWLAQGITGRAADMSLFAGSPAGAVVTRWLALRDAFAAASIVHSRQVHEAGVLVHTRVPQGLLIGPDADGHVTGAAGVLLAVSVADCVPISIAAQDRRAVALLHAGWRGVVAGILERGISVLRSRLGVRAQELRVHFGPAICGDCFEVGPEVPAALGLAVPETGARPHVDLRAALAHRAQACGVPAAHISTSTFCTRCGDSPFYSHRGGCAERQIAILGVRSGT